jgi:hypothetical protein
MRLSWAFRPGHRPDHLLIACFPKSGSTYLNNVLHELTGLRKAFAAERGPQHEQDLCARKLMKLRHRCILQQHVKATCTNLELLATLGMRPIVQTRSLFDVVVSLHDHLQQNPRSLSCGFASDGYLRMAWSERVDYLIHLYLPWYFNFILSWREAARQIDVYPISYEQLFADQRGELTRIAAFYGFQVSGEQVASAMARAARSNTRLNVGIVGRGNELLSARHKQSIHLLASICEIDINESGSIVPLIEPRHIAA